MEYYPTVHSPRSLKQELRVHQSSAADVYSSAIVAYEMVTGFPPHSDVPHDEYLALRICNGLRPKIPSHIPKLITRLIMQCWDARVDYRPTFEELYKKLNKYSLDYREYICQNNSEKKEITVQIEEYIKFEEPLASPFPINYARHPEAIYTSRFLAYSNLPKPVNEPSFEKELEQ